METNEVLGLLENELFDPGGLKSGEYLEEHVRRRSASIVRSDRQGLIEALRYWIETRSEPRTMLAVSVAKDLGLVELTPDIRQLKKDIEHRGVFPAFYVREVVQALSALCDRQVPNSM